MHRAVREIALSLSNHSTFTPTHLSRRRTRPCARCPRDRRRRLSAHRFRRHYRRRSHHPTGARRSEATTPVCAVRSRRGIALRPEGVVLLSFLAPSAIVHAGTPAMRALAAATRPSMKTLPKPSMPTCWHHAALCLHRVTTAGPLYGIRGTRTLIANVITSVIASFASLCPAQSPPLAAPPSVLTAVSPRADSVTPSERRAERARAAYRMSLLRSPVRVCTGMGVRCRHLSPLPRLPRWES